MRGFDHHADRARDTRSEARPATVLFAEVAVRRDARDAQRQSAVVRQYHRLCRTSSAQQLRNNVRPATERVAFDPEVTPVPTSPSDWGLPKASSVMASEAVRVPIAVGLNVTLILQVVAGASVNAQAFVVLKSMAAAPVIATLPIFNGRPLTLLRVTIWALLVPARRLDAKQEAGFGKRNDWCL